MKKKVSCELNKRKKKSKERQEKKKHKKRRRESYAIWLYIYVLQGRLAILLVERGWENFMRYGFQVC